MNVTEFIKKWRKVQLNERAASQEHFLDLCALLGHPTPAAADPEGSSFTFEKGVRKRGGGDGWADVWKKGFFGWEYKGRHRNLDAAYNQLLQYAEAQYAEALENPPLLVVCDTARIIVHTHFNNAPVTVHEIPLAEMGEPANLAILRAVFCDPERLRPERTPDEVTEEAAQHIAAIAQSLRDRGLEPHTVARFLDRIVFCLFAEDIGLLPDGLFSRILEKAGDDPERFTKLIGQLFEAMAVGGDFGLETIRHFDGNLFMDGPVLALTEPEIAAVGEAARLDWSAIKPSILGTLFERGLDPTKRAQLGAHYTSEDDIRTLVEPVVMAPLRREWAEVRQAIDNLLATGRKSAKPIGNRKSEIGNRKPLTGAKLRKARDEAVVLVNRFLERLSRVRVLDPACGSGNFLYVTLQVLKDLEKQVVTYAADRELGGFLPRVLPTQLHGIEINPYAFELAQMTVWIGWLQWTRNNGFGWPADPVLRPMDTFENKDAILDLSDPACPREPTWPKVDFIVGNPPFLGNKLLRSRLGDEYVPALWDLYKGRVGPSSDLCAYWFEKARHQIETGACERAGLLATTALKQVGSRFVLERVQETADIFFAVSDRDWVLDGCSVRICMIGFGATQTAQERQLDGRTVGQINANLTAGPDLTRGARLAENAGVCYMGITKVGAFDVDSATGVSLLSGTNPHGRPNSDVLRPLRNGSDVVRVCSDRWIIDFGTDRSLGAAARYEAPFEYLVKNVKPSRERNNRRRYRELWWIHAEARPGLRDACEDLPRYIATPRVSKHRVFVFLDTVILPDSKLLVVASADEVVFGVLHSALHTAWTVGTCAWHGIGNDVTYNPTTCFETFPFPGPTAEQAAAIAEAARELNALRERWLNPPEWVREEILEFPGTVGGPWTRYIEEDGGRCAVEGGRGPEHRTPSTEHRSAPRIGTVRYPRLVPRDAECAAKLKKRTLTNLYNARPTWLDMAHRALDAAVFAAYGWEPEMTDEQILERLLALNLERAAAES